MSLARIFSAVVVTCSLGLGATAHAAPYYTKQVKIQIANVLGLGNADVKKIKFSSWREIRYTKADGGRIDEVRRGTYSFGKHEGALAVKLFRDGGVQVTSPSRVPARTP